MYIIVAVFIAGLMVGRTPEYLGKKVEAKEVKLAMLAVLIHPLLICVGTGDLRGDLWGKATVANPGPHGFSEILYEFTSAAANNGSGFEGLGGQQPAVEHRHGHRPAAGPIPGPDLPAGDRRVPLPEETRPQTAGTLRTDNLTFAGMLLGTVLLVGALSFMPAVVLGPIADHLTTVQPSS